MKRLSGKVATVTGASAGIGRATAELFDAEGAKVIVGARRQAELDALVAEIVSDGGDPAALAGDIRSEDYARALVALAVKRFGKLDIAFNNAGTSAKAPRPPAFLKLAGTVPLPSILPARSLARSTRSARC
ncbi:NAD(P)-dependent dehydrogenase (short-subunit alcohol dehydrogenase family) [Bradyrhizobium sp. LA8.1]